VEHILMSASRPGLGKRLSAFRRLSTLLLLGLLAFNMSGGIARGEDLVIEFLYGSEKEAWINKVTANFNRAGHLVNGKKVVIKTIAAGSGEAMEDLLSGRSKAQLFSPASSLFIERANARAVKAGGAKLVDATKTLVLSPVVIAMWEPMARALGWPGKPIGWADVLKVANDPKGWAGLGHPEFGLFKFGHTHPEHSNSGFISVLAEVHAGAGVPPGGVLSKKDVDDPKAAEFLRGIESSVVYYGKSTGFFATTMFASGPQYLSAAVLYESSVIESYDRVRHPPSKDFDKAKFPVVAIYPADGTFWSDHPVGLVDRNLKSADEGQAAREYINYLLAKPQQILAMETGFRPGDDGIALASPLDKAHGVDPEIDIPVRQIPSDEVLSGVLNLWRANKRHVRVTIMLDRSQSMLAQQKMVFAKLGAAEAVTLLGDDDRLSVLLFDTKPVWLVKDGETKAVRAQALSAIPNIMAQGQTALYDALKVTLDDLDQAGREDLISAVVLLSDGQDTSSKVATLKSILDRLRAGAERSKVRVFTIYYGDDAKKGEMEEIAKACGAMAFEGRPENIAKVFKEIFIFFGEK